MNRHPFAPGVIDHDAKPSSLWVDLAVAVALMAISLVAGFAAGYIPRLVA